MAKINPKIFQHLSKTLAKIRTTNLEEGIFVGTQICESLEDEACVESLINTEQAAWGSSKWICANSLSGKKSSDFSKCIQQFLNAYKETGSRIIRFVIPVVSL